MTPTELKKYIPLERTFGCAEIADKAYPPKGPTGANGQSFNPSCAVVARMLRKISGVEEVRHGVFYAHKEFFK